MGRRRSILLHGLKLVVTIPGALLWTYALNLGLALVFSLRGHAQLSSILDHSLAAERLNSAFDLGTLQEALHRMSYNVPSSGSTDYAGVPLYLLGYFILVPGTLFCFQTAAPSRLSILVGSGISFFWRFVRITLLAGMVSGVILGPLGAAQAVWSQHVDDRMVGSPALWREIPGLIVIALAAALLRLYFDLIEVFTVQLGDQYRPDGRQDRRVRRVLLPAARALKANCARAYGSFLSLTVLGFAAVGLTSWMGARMLAQPRVWPVFLLAQAGLFAMMATRFWQRGAETILACDFPLPMPAPPIGIATLIDTPPIRYTPPQLAADAQSDPEPAVPSLDEPDTMGHHQARGSHEPTSSA
jgi:hypothetical protein